jgi:hypothetical protein
VWGGWEVWEVWGDGEVWDRDETYLALINRV